MLSPTVPPPDSLLNSLSPGTALNASSDGAAALSLPGVVRWVVDSGATWHASGDFSLASGPLRACSDVVRTAAGHRVRCAGMADVAVSLVDSAGRASALTMRDVRFFEGFEHNLFSTGQAEKRVRPLVLCALECV